MNRNEKIQIPYGYTSWYDFVNKEIEQPLSSYSNNELFTINLEVSNHTIYFPSYFSNTNTFIQISVEDLKLLIYEEIAPLIHTTYQDYVGVMMDFAKIKAQANDMREYSACSVFLNNFSKLYYDNDKRNSHTRTDRQAIQILQ